jgi:hypothetical protein
LERGAVQLGEAARQREADAEAAAAHVRAMLRHLREHLEDFLELLARNAEARVPDAHQRVALAAFRSYFDRTAGLRVLGRVAEQVADDLRETFEIAAHVDWLSGRLDDELVPALDGERSRQLDGGRDDRLQIDDHLL